jgi:NADH dehydrogenase
MSDRPHAVIIGGGFGGLSAARALKSAPMDVTLIDRRNFHLFQPLLYQVATGSLSWRDFCSIAGRSQQTEERHRVAWGRG